MRQCGECQLCCRLLPVKALGKPGGEACRFQKFHKGCTVYRTPKMPPECALWNCRWLVNDDTAELSRPDRSHYVIDIMPDFITVRNNETGSEQHVQVVQIWVDPNHRDAHRDPKLRAYLERRATEGVAAIVRFGERDSLILIPPVMSSEQRWHEVTDGVSGPTHTPVQVAAALGRLEIGYEP